MAVSVKNRLLKSAHGWLIVPTENWHVIIYLYQDKVCESQESQQWERNIFVQKQNGTEKDCVHAWKKNVFYWIDTSHLIYSVSFWSKGHLKLSYKGFIIMKLHVCHGGSNKGPVMQKLFPHQTSSCTVLTTSDGHWPAPSLYECSWDESKHAFLPFVCNCMLASYHRVPISVTAISDISPLKRSYLF